MEENDGGVEMNIYDFKTKSEYIPRKNVSVDDTGRLGSMWGIPVLKCTPRMQYFVSRVLQSKKRRDC